VAGGRPVAQVPGVGAGYRDVERDQRKPATCAGLLRVGQQARESAPAIVVDRAWHPDRAAADSAGGQVQDGRDGAAATADRPVGRQRVGLGGGAARHVGCTRDRDEGAVTGQKFLAEDVESGALLGDRPGECAWIPEVVTECEMDHAVGLCGARADDVQVGEISSEGFGAGRLEGQPGRVGAGEREDGVAGAEQLGDDGGADQPGTTGDEDVLGALLEQ